MCICVSGVLDTTTHGPHVRMAGNLVPLTPTMPSRPTFPRRRRSNMVRPTTPTFLSDAEAPPPTKPVVYSPVPIWTAAGRGQRRRLDGERGKCLP